jgi:putative nucleotidyltransferase with HDIG domain
MKSNTILVVDDERDILELLQETFEDAGYRVSTAVNAMDALEIFEKESPDVILSDNRMPGMSGIEFFEELREKASDSVRILMTGYADLNIAIEAINRGWVYKFVAKPFKLEEILLTIQRALEYYEIVKQKKRLEKKIRQHNAILEQRVTERTKDLQELMEELEVKNRTLTHQKTEIRELYSHLQRSYLGTISALYFALEARDPYTRGHSERVFHYCLHVGKRLGLSSAELVNLKYAALLHDLGKIGVPDSILKKPGRLTEEEYRTIKDHPVVGAAILDPVNFLSRAKEIIHQHHEHYDGAGYPDGLKADRINIQGRIIAVVDAFDAMRSDRPYRNARTQQDALAELNRLAGMQFCPQCVQIFEEVLMEIGDFYDHPELLENYSEELQFMRDDMPGLSQILTQPSWDMTAEPCEL